MPNSLFYGDNLDILREHVSDESVDLVYLDPPFNSNASYNVLFKEQSGEEYPRLQILTIGELLEGKGFEMPPHPPMYLGSQRVKSAEGEQGRLA